MIQAQVKGASEASDDGLHCLQPVEWDWGLDPQIQIGTGAGRVPGMELKPCGKPWATNQWRRGGSGDGTNCGLPISREREAEGDIEGEAK